MKATNNRARRLQALNAATHRSNVEAVAAADRHARDFTRMDDFLKPGGWLGIMTEMVTPDNDFKSWWYHRDPTHVCFYRQETMAWMAGKFSWALMLTRKNVTLFRKSRCQT